MALKALESYCSAELIQETKRVVKLVAVETMFSLFQKNIKELVATITASIALFLKFTTHRSTLNPLKTVHFVQIHALLAPR